MVNAIELLATNDFSKTKLKVNELKSLNCNCHNLVHRVMVSNSFHYLSMLNNNFKEIMNCKNY